MPLTVLEHERVGVVDPDVVEVLPDLPLLRLVALLALLRVAVTGIDDEALSAAGSGPRSLLKLRYIQCQLTGNVGKGRQRMGAAKRL